MLINFDGSAFQILRVYAISGRLWQFALLVGTLNIFPNFAEIVRNSVHRSAVRVASCDQFLVRVGPNDLWKLFSDPSQLWGRRFHVTKYLQSVSKPLLRSFLTNTVAAAI